MPIEADELKRKLDEMLTSSNKEWVNTVTLTLNAMHRQFELERQGEKTAIPFAPLGTPKTQIGFLYRKLLQDRLGCNAAEPRFLLLIFWTLFPA
jgi:hypothetical protein